MIPVAELDKIAKARLYDAKALLEADRHDGAAYLCGYAVEVALKARICRTLNWSGFPSTSGELQAYRSFQTHDLDVLLHLSGQEVGVREIHFAIWNRVAAWRSEWRYNFEGPQELLALTVKQIEAKEMIEAAEELLHIL